MNQDDLDKIYKIALDVRNDLIKRSGKSVCTYCVIYSEELEYKLTRNGYNSEIKDGKFYLDFSDEYSSYTAAHT